MKRGEWRGGEGASTVEGAKRGGGRAGGGRRVCYRERTSIIFVYHDNHFLSSAHSYEPMYDHKWFSKEPANWTYSSIFGK